MNFTNEQNQFVKTFCCYLYCIHFNWKSFSNWGSRTLKGPQEDAKWSA